MATDPDASPSQGTTSPAGGNGGTPGDSAGPAGDSVAPVSDAAVPGWARRLGLPGLADVHVHFLPARLLQRIWTYFDDGGPLIGRPWPIHYRLPEEQRLERLRSMGVRVFTALVYPHRPGIAAGLNAWAADFARRTPECLPTATFFAEPEAAGYVRDAIDGGAALFKVHLQVGGFDPREPSLDPVWGMLAEAGVPALVHAGSGPVANGYTGPGPFGEVMARHPRLKAIVAHLGAPEFTEFFDLATRYENLCLDTTTAFTDFFGAMAGGHFPERLYPVLRDLGLTGRVLLGSDFPNIPYPYAHQLAALAGLGMGEEWLRAVCWHNAIRLFAHRLPYALP